MNLRETIEAEHTKEAALRVVAYVGDSQERLEELLELVESREVRLAQRAAWPLSYIFDSNPQLVIPYILRLLKLLEDPVHDAIPRGVLRAIALVDVPEEYWGETLDPAFEYLQNPQIPVAIRVHAMQIIFNVSRKLPEIGHELKLIIEAQLPEASAGFRSRAKKLLKKL